MSIEQFRQAMQRAGLDPPADINPNGKIHRFSTNCRADDESGWYLFDDGVAGHYPAAGAFGCLKRGIDKTWSADGKQAPDLDGARVIETRYVRVAPHPEAVKAPEREWLIEGWQPRGLGFTYGTTGFLKSFFEMWQAISAAAGRSILGHKILTPSGCLRTLILHNEDTPDRIEYDINRMAARLDLTATELDAVRENLRVACIADLDMRVAAKNFGSLSRTAVVNDIAFAAQDFDAGLVLFDTISGIEPSGGDFGEKALEVIRAMYSIMTIAQCGCHGIAHVSKEVSRQDLRDVGSILGSVQYGNKSRVARYVAKPTEDEMAAAPAEIRSFLDECQFHGERPAISILGVSKISHAAPIEEIVWLARSSKRVLVLGSDAPKHAKRAALEARVSKACAEVLGMLAGRDGVSVRELEGMSGLPRNATRVAVERLLADGRIVEELVTSLGGRPRRVFRTVK